jgi:hypothetical protein
MSKLSKVALLARHWVWIAPIVLGIGFIVGGGYMIIEGRSAHNDVRDSLVDEAITVSGDAENFAGQRVDSPEEADAQAAAIKHHTLAATGGYLYAEMGQYFQPEGNYMLPNGTFMTDDGGTTTDASVAAKDANGKPINYTTNVDLAAKNASDQPVRAWTSDKTLAATDANGAPVANALRNTAKDSAFLRTSLGVATMGFKVSDLVVGLGAFLIFMGLLNVFIMSPVTYWATVVADEHERTRVKEAAREAVKGSPQTT